MTVRQPISTRWRDRAPPALLFLLALGFLIIAYGFDAASGQVPRLIGWSMVVLTGLDLASRSGGSYGRAFARWVNPEAKSRAAVQPAIGRQIVAVAGIVGFVTLLILVGILPSVPAFVLAATRFGGRRSWIVSLSAAAGATALIWALFSALLRLALFPGLLFGGA